MTYQATKTDASLGKQVQEHLTLSGVATPTRKYADTAFEINNQRARTEEEKIDAITHHFAQIMEIIGLDLADDSLAETPRRVAKMYVKELFWGLDPGKFPKATTVDNKMAYDSMVVEKDITVMSACEHHFVTIDGKATVAYIPNQKVLGLSKLNRIVEYFSRRPQIQERLTEQVWHALSFILGTENVAVYIDAEHYCVKSRGIEDHGSHTITSKLGGAFRDNATTRAEFMSIAR